MVKLMQMPPQEVVDGFKGKIDFYFWNRMPIVRMWPRYPKRKPYPLEKQWQDIFAYIVKWWKDLPDNIKLAFAREANRTKYSPRDLLTRAYLTGIPPFAHAPSPERDWWAYERFLVIKYEHEWVGDVKHIVLTTDRTCHLWAAVSKQYPYSRDRWVVWRGAPRRHGIDVYWTPELSVEQAEPGDTITHTIDIRGWSPCLQRFWYFYGDILGERSPSNTCFWTQHFLEPGPVPGPQPMLVPLWFEVEGRVIRCGNHYTFWANETWYAVVPCADSVTIWKKVGQGMVRQDQANEMVSAVGNFTDGDARIELSAEKIHVVAFEAVASPGPPRLMYCTYNLASDTWDFPELVCYPRFSFFAVQYCSLSLDANDIPHVLYNDYSNAFPEFHYRNRIAGSWSSPEIALNPPANVAMYSSIWHDPTDDALHCLCVTNVSTLKYRRRPLPPDPWDTLFPVGASTNLPMHSLMANDQDPHIAGVPIDWRVDHWEGQPPLFQNPDLTAPTSNYANMIQRLNDPGYLQIMFRDNDSHLAYVWRTPGIAWQDQVQMDPDDVIIVASNYNHPDIISTLWTAPGLYQVYIWAFYTHWH